MQCSIRTKVFAAVLFAGVFSLVSGNTANAQCQNHGAGYGGYRPGYGSNLGYNSYTNPGYYRSNGFSYNYGYNNSGYGYSYNYNHNQSYSHNAYHPGYRHHNGHGR